MTVNLGPAGLSLLNGKSDNSSYPFEHNPRCLKRSLTDESNQRFANETSVLNLLTKPQDVYDFEFTMQGWPNSAEQGVHVSEALLSYRRNRNANMLVQGWWPFLFR